MTRLAEAALSEDERKLVERLVEELRAELGESLRAVWHYGSRARGEPPGPDSDIDLLAISDDDAEADQEALRRLSQRVSEELGFDQFYVSLIVNDVSWLAGRREIDAFYIREVDRDKIVVFGDGLEGVGRGEGGVVARDGLVGGDGVATRSGSGLSARSEEYLEDAREHLSAARLALNAELANPAISAAYTSMLNVARAALSEEDMFARTHKGTWHLFHQTFVLEGGFDAQLHKRAAGAQNDRVDADYGGRSLGLAKAREAVALAETFLAGVERLLAN